MLRRTVLKGLSATAAASALARPAVAQTTTLKIGLSFPMTGAGFASVGRQLKAGTELYLLQHGDTVAGRKIEVILRDDGGIGDAARRVMQEMIVNDKVDICGVGVTPAALAIAPLVTEAKKATMIMSTGASIAISKSPYFIRSGFIISTPAWVMGEWAVKNGMKHVVTLVNDWAPGIEAETAFKTPFVKLGGEIIESIRVPLANPDFAPFLQRISDLHPETAFIMVPGSQSPIFARQFAERGLVKSGIKIIGTGDITDDDDLNNMGDAMLGIITAGQYSASHDSALNKSYVAAMQKEKGIRADFISLGGYDGMHLIYEALKKTKGDADGDALIGAIKGMAWESPRGPVSIDPATRDLINNIYIRKVEKIDGQLWNTEFDTYTAVSDPMKTAAK
ncbi:MAG TPA: ABC transporter substrate-binding protein [Xanthobacteraceae bacterium]|jgi:branched-chain amino acid transport system substrate-binding protein|nr:ABC transporter substrate-binding protein [Xanthobacteraceae bacterium]